MFVYKDVQLDPRVSVTNSPPSAVRPRSLITAGSSPVCCDIARNINQTCNLR